jgi:hypothetical protein
MKMLLKKVEQDSEIILSTVIQMPMWKNKKSGFVMKHLSFPFWEGDGCACGKPSATAGGWGLNRGWS